MALPALSFNFLSTLPGPIFPESNFRVLQALFRFFPHTDARDALAQFLIDSPLASTWAFAAAFYYFWRVQDERTLWRRGYLLALIASFCAIVIVTLIFRPWVGWPAPSLVIGFRELFPQFLWAQGNMNCFPSHSTFAYMFVALGLWPFNRRLSVLLMLATLLLISLPRVYVGGHYPIDVLAGILLAAAGVGLARLSCGLSHVRNWLERAASGGAKIEVFLFLWLFELGEGFRSGYGLWLTLLRVARGGFH